MGGDLVPAGWRERPRQHVNAHLYIHRKRYGVTSVILTEGTKLDGIDNVTWTGVSYKNQLNMSLKLLYFFLALCTSRSSNTKKDGTVRTQSFSLCFLQPFFLFIFFILYPPPSPASGLIMLAVLSAYQVDICAGPNCQNESKQMISQEIMCVCVFVCLNG